MHQAAGLQMDRKSRTGDGHKKMVCASFLSFLVKKKRSAFALKNSRTHQNVLVSFRNF
jgi:hypothetical protein